MNRPYAKNYRLSWSLIFITMLCVICAGVLMLIPIFSENTYLVTFVGEASLLIPIFIGAARLFKCNSLENSLFRGFSPWVLPIVVLLPIAMQPFINLVTLPFGTILNAVFGADTSSLPIPENIIDWVLAVITICIAAPFFEELLFRGIIMRLLENYGIIRCLFASALGFALLHFSPQNFIVIFFLGLLLGTVRLLTNSLTACIIAHAANNISAFLFEMFPTLSERLSPVFSIICIILFPVLMWLLLTLSPKDNRRSIQKRVKAPHISVCKILCLSLYAGYMLLLLVANLSEFFTGVPYILQ